jgi:hypothetical protein
VDLVALVEMLVLVVVEVEEGAQIITELLERVVMVVEV